MNATRPIVGERNANVIERSWKDPDIPRAAVIGFGNRSRGVVIPRLIASGFNVYALESKKPLVDTYKDGQGCYHLTTINNMRGRDYKIEGPWVMDTETELGTFIEKAAETPVKLIITATSPIPIKTRSADPKNPANIVRSILEARYAARNNTPVNVICTESTPAATKIIEERISAESSSSSAGFREWLTTSVGFVDTVVDAILPKCTEAEMRPIWARIGAVDRLLVLAEENTQWFMERGDFRGSPPKLKGITYTDNIAPYQMRYTHMFNCAQFAVAVLGTMMGKRFMNTAAGDGTIQSFTQGMLETEVIPTLAPMKQFDEPLLRDHANSSLSRISNPLLKDEVSRIMSNPFRKLNRNERLLAPALSAMEFGIKPQRLCFVIAAALHHAGVRHDVSGDQESPDAPEHYLKHLGRLQGLIREAADLVKKGQDGIPNAMKKLETVLSDRRLCGLNLSEYSERQIANIIKHYFEMIAKSADYERTLDAMLNEERKTIIIRPPQVPRRG